jgi:hypothetical protein
MNESTIDKESEVSLENEKSIRNAYRAAGKIKRFDCYPSGTIVLTELGVLENLSAAYA